MEGVHCNDEVKPFFPSLWLITSRESKVFFLPYILLPRDLLKMLLRKYEIHSFCGSLTFVDSGAILLPYVNYRYCLNMGYVFKKVFQIVG